MLASAAIMRLLSFDTYVLREREFLPAALEVTDTPPNPLGRLTALTLCLVALGGLGWAIFGKVDIVARKRQDHLPHAHASRTAV
jgi:hemolysin D